MLEEGLLPSGEAYGAAMSACARGGMVDLALELLERVLTEHPDDQRVRTCIKYSDGGFLLCCVSRTSDAADGIQLS